MRQANNQIPERSGLQELDYGGEQATKAGGLRGDADLTLAAPDGTDSVCESDRGPSEGAVPGTELGAPACANHLEAFRGLAQALGALWGERLYREAKKEDKQ